MVHLVLVHVQILVILPRTDFNSLQLQHNIALSFLSTHNTTGIRIPTKSVKYCNHASQARARRDHEVPLHLLQEFGLQQCTYCQFLMFDSEPLD